MLLLKEIRDDLILFVTFVKVELTLSFGLDFRVHLYIN